MFENRGPVRLKEIRQLVLVQPEGFPFQLDFQFGLAFRCLVDDDSAFIFKAIITLNTTI